jgi:hypothetical protein
MEKNNYEKWCNYFESKFSTPLFEVFEDGIYCIPCSEIYHNFCDNNQSNKKNFFITAPANPSEIRVLTNHVNSHRHRSAYGNYCKIKNDKKVENISVVGNCKYDKSLSINNDCRDESKKKMYLKY